MEQKGVRRTLIGIACPQITRRSRLSFANARNTHLANDQDVRAELKRVRAAVPEERRRQAAQRLTEYGALSRSCAFSYHDGFGVHSSINRNTPVRCGSR